MSDYQHVLFPVDFSSRTDAVIPYVAAVARHLNATVTLLSVVPPIWQGPGVKPEFPSELEKATKEKLDRTLTGEVHGFAMERAIRSGEPAEQIVQFAEQQAVDLIMMPTHGHGKWRGLLLGSVTAKVLHDARCPVWTAAHATEQHARPLPKTILCCVDGSPASAALLRQAADFSGRLEATLRLIHIVRPGANWEGLEGEQAREERDAAQARLQRLCAEAGVTAPLEIVAGLIAPAVAQRATEEAADLVIIGRGKIGARLGRLRTHAQAIIQSARCPVLSF